MICILFWLWPIPAWQNVFIIAVVIVIHRCHYECQRKQRRTRMGRRKRRRGGKIGGKSSLNCLILDPWHKYMWHFQAQISWRLRDLLTSCIHWQESQSQEEITLIFLSRAGEFSFHLSYLTPTPVSRSISHSHLKMFTLLLLQYCLALIECFLTIGC